MGVNSITQSFYAILNTVHKRFTLRCIHTYSHLNYSYRTIISIALLASGLYIIIYNTRLLNNDMLVCGNEAGGTPTNGAFHEINVWIPLDFQCRSALRAKDGNRIGSMAPKIMS